MSAEPPPRDEELVAEDDAVIGRVFVRSLQVLAALAVAALLVVALRYVFRAGPEEAQEIAVAAPRPVAAAPEVPVVPFTDITAEAGIDFVHVNGAEGEALLPETMGAGAAFFDFDRDGDQDLLLVNSTEWSAAAGNGPTMALYENDGAGRFTDRTVEMGLATSFYGTGVAVGDVDNDGDVDVLVTNNAGPAQLLINLVGQDRAWIGLRAIEPDPERDALGSLVEVRLSGGRSLVRRVRTARSYASSSDPRVIFGLGDAEGVAEVRVRWLGGLEESFGPLAIRRYHTLRRGEGAQVR